MKPWTRAILVVAGIAAVGLLVWAFWPAPLRVEAAKVVEGTFVDEVEEDCLTRVRNRYVVSAPAAGRVLRIGTEAGDAVRAGDPVATLTPTVSPLVDARTRAEQEESLGAAEAAVVAADAEVDRIRAVLLQAQAEASRVAVLADRGIVSKQEKEKRDLAVTTAERDVRAAEMRRHAVEHQVDAAKAALALPAGNGSVGQIDVAAPTDGTVLAVNQVSEAVVAAGSPLLEIGDPADLQVICEVLTTDVVRIVPGSQVEIDRWGGTGALAATVARIEPAGFTKISALGVEEQRVRVIVEITSPREKWKTLGDAYRVIARIEIGRQEGATLAPAAALFRRGEGWGAFVIDENVARERAVTLLGRSAGDAAVGDGLAPGDTVVVFPPNDLRDGSRVRLEARP